MDWLDNRSVICSIMSRILGAKMDFRSSYLGWFFTLIVLTQSSSIARGEELFAHLYELSSPGSVELDISPCTGDEVSECVYHALSCDPAEEPSIQLRIVAGPVEPVVRNLIKAEDGVASAEVSLSAGATKISLPIPSIEINSNELDGAWMVALGFYETDAFMDALTARSAEGATIAAGGATLSLAPQRGDGAKLVKWREACLRLRGQ